MALSAIFITISQILSVVVVLGFNEECNGVYDAITDVQVYPVDVCEGERIDGQVQSEIYFCGALGEVSITTYFSTDCTGSEGFTTIAYFPFDTSVNLNCGFNKTEDCTYAIVRTYLDDDECEKGDVSRPDTDYFDSTEPVNRCRYNLETDTSTMITCDSTSISETYYNGNGCGSTPTSTQVIIETGCDDDFSHLSQHFTDRQAYTEIIFCPTGIKYI